MNKIFHNRALGAALCALLLSASASAADRNTATNSDTMRSGNMTESRKSSGAVDVGLVASGMRAEKVIGSTVYNQANESVGSIDDLIIEPTNRVVYAIVSVGGFLGVGDRLVAVPFDSINFRREDNDMRVVMSGSTKAQLEAMPEFRYTR